MKSKLKQQKGITLVALVITIIVISQFLMKIYNLNIFK